MVKPKILLLGKLPPPHIGPAIAMEILLKSGLHNHYSIYHLNTNVHNALNTIGLWNFEKIYKNIFIYFNLFKLIIRHRPSLVLVPISQSTLGFLKDSIFILICRMLCRKTIIHLRGSNFKNWLNTACVITRCYVAFILSRCQGVIVLGKKLRYLFSDYFSEDRIFTVPNGGNFRIPYKKNNNSTPQILYLGNLQRSKGIEDVIKAGLILKEEYQLDFNINVVGGWRDKSTKNTCLQIVTKSNLPIVFYSPVGGAKKFSFLAKSDIFIFVPCEPEGHPWVIIEAMAAGLPIISADQGAITECVMDAVNGFIVEKQNPEQLARKIRFLIQHPDIRKNMGKESQRLYLENFTEEKMVTRLTRCFNVVLNQS